MIKKENRLTKRKEFNFIYKNGKRVYNSDIMLCYIPTKLEKCRFGIVVSKKIGKAHVRNKVKRRISEIIRLNLEKFNNKYNYIFVVKPSVVDIDYKQLEAQVIALLNKV